MKLYQIIGNEFSSLTNMAIKEYEVLKETNASYQIKEGNMMRWVNKKRQVDRIYCDEVFSTCLEKACSIFMTRYTSYINKLKSELERAKEATRFCDKYMQEHGLRQMSVNMKDEHKSNRLTIEEIVNQNSKL